jgi:hypothetical protein
MSKQEINGTIYWENSSGNLVPEEMVKPYEQLKDGIVQAISEKIKKMKKEMEEIKNETMSDIDTFMEIAAEEYKVNLGGKKGNVTLTSYDGSIKIVIANSTNQEFNEKINFAKALIDEYLTELTKDSAIELKTIISSAFKIRQGKLDVRRILELRSYDIKDSKWKRAMELINESLEITNSNRCFRLYVRNDSGNSYDRVNMDFATVG